METFRELLQNIHGGRVLDVATGNGGFIQVLHENLADYSEIIGIDINDRFAAAFAESFKDYPNIQFQQIDATCLPYEDSSFDFVSISHSLHHLDPPVVFREIMRVLRPGGFFVISEMYQDHQSETQMTHVLLHHWWAAVDRTTGVYHQETFTRQEILDMVYSLGLSDLKCVDIADLDVDPRDAQILDYLNPAIERYIQRAEGHPDLQARGEELRQRVKEIGFHSATVLAALGKKGIKE